MFVETDVVEFINRIINVPKTNNSEVKKNIIKFRDYLVLTKMTDQETIDKVDKIIACLDSIITVKNTLGFVDISALINAPVTEEIKKLRKVPITQSQYSNKHYHHYHNDDSASSCYTCGAGSSRSSSRYSSSCGTSSSSSCYTCGASSASRSRC